MDDGTRELLRNLPKIDEIMLLLEKEGRCPGVRRDIVRQACRRVVDEMRREVLEGGRPPMGLAEVGRRAAGIVAAMASYRLRRVINATGVILHTNLGRAPLAGKVLAQVSQVAGGYSNLEFDVGEGGRGSRHDHVRELLCALTGAQDALVVNNNAAAVLLVLNTLAQGKEAIVSRGELIEIGGEFRIPDVMERSGTRLREVGTTNRTRLADYEKALGPETAVILKVHPSNFRIIGFTEETALAELVSLAGRYGLPVLNDLGSGCLVDLGCFGLEREPTVQEAVAAGADVVTFSGDKLLGGPQAGIIVGKRELLALIARNPLARALRIDKLTLAALEATLSLYLKQEEAIRELPVLKALAEPLSSIRRRAKRLASLLTRLLPAAWEVSLLPGASAAGGGSLPGLEIPTVLVGLAFPGRPLSLVEKRLRDNEPPIIARVGGDRLLFDPRTLGEGELKEVAAALGRIAAEGG